MAGATDGQPLRNPCLLYTSILATVCTATFAWREDLDKVSLTAKSVLLNAKMDLANNAESDLGVLNLAALQDGQTAYIPVSYTHLDVYKRQIFTVRLQSCKSVGLRWNPSA